MGWEGLLEEVMGKREQQPGQQAGEYSRQGNPSAETL